MKLRNKSQSVVLTWLFSYLAVLLLPVLISIGVYIESSRTLESEIHQANRSLLNQVKESMENTFQSMQLLNFEITWNVQVQELLFSNKYLSYPNEYTYDLYKISQDLKMYKNAYSSIDSFYIYLPTEDTVILPSIVRGGSYAYGLIHSDPSFTYEQWKSIVSSKYMKQYIPVIRVSEDGRRHKAIAYVSTYPSDKEHGVATNVIMVDRSHILGSIENIEYFNQGHVLVFNKDNELLASNNSDAMTADFPFGLLKESSGFFYYKSGSKRYEVQYIQSPANGLKYVSMIPSSLYWQKAEHVRNLTYASLFVSLVAGGLLTFFFLRRNYNPLRRLVQAVSGKAAAAKDGRDRNEFHLIQEAIDRTLGEMDTMAQKMKRQHRLMRSNFITRLLKGRIDSNFPIEESLAAFNMNFKSDHFAVILFYVEESEPFYERIQDMEPNEKRKLLQFVVINVVEELASQHNRGYAADIEESIACLVNFYAGDEEARKAELLRIAGEAQQFLSTHYHIHLTVSISSIHDSFAGISQAYTEALDAMEYKLIMGSKQILSYEQLYKDTTRTLDTGYYYPLQVEQQLINYVKVGDLDKAKQTLDDIIERNISGRTVSVPLARCLMLDLVSTMMKTISEIGDINESFLVQNPNVIARLTACETIQDMREQMAKLLAKVCEYTHSKREQNIHQSRQKALSELIDSVNELIERQYADPNLNISMIGSHFDMKPTYLSKLFKDHTGEGLLDTINKVRIDRAKALIAGKNKNVGDVAGCVGFNDVNAFIRTFKKYEGITPGKFKESIEQ